MKLTDFDPAIQEALACFEALRRLGFPSDDIYFAAPPSGLNEGNKMADDKEKTTWLQRFPNPGKSSPVPGPEPTPPPNMTSIDAPEYQEYKTASEQRNKRKTAYLEWVIAIRKAIVAEALDKILLRPWEKRSSADMVAWVLGMEYLNGEIGRESNVFGLFGL